MKKTDLRMISMYILIVAFFLYNLLFAPGFYSMFSGIYYQPPLIFSVLSMFVECLLISQAVPNKLKVISPIICGLFFSCYFFIRFVLVFDFAQSIDLIHYFVFGFPLVVGILIGCVILVHKKIKRKL